MKKILIDDLYSKLSQILSEKEGKSIVYSMKGGMIAKIFDTDYLNRLLDIGYNLEEKILNSKTIEEVPEIIVPSAPIYMSNGNFVGYTMPEAEGISYDEYNNGKLKYDYKSSCDLYRYASEFSKLENIIKKSNDIVYPDILSRNNTFFDGDNFQFIDYDGIQVNGYLSQTSSSSLGRKSDYQNTKYMNGNLFNKNLDIKSLIYLYFYTVFGVDLGKIDNEYSFDKEYAIESIFNDLCIDDEELKEKVFRLYSDEPNIYLGDTVNKIADNYKMDIGYNGKRYIKQK